MRRRRWLALVIGALVIAVAFLVGALPRLRARNTVRSETAELAVPYVSVVRPQPTARLQELVLPGNVEAFADTPIFARTSGYLKRWYVDIGATVKRDQLLAVIESPEVDQQLAQARQVLVASEANLRTAEITAKRLGELRKLNAVAQQDLDTAIGSVQANQGTVAGNRADVKRLEYLKSFENVRAPFDGIITNRNTDVGDLINAGSTTPNTELFHIVQPHKLRVYVEVPEPYAGSVAIGLTAKLVFAASPGRTVTGTLVRTASAITPATRTLQVEITVDNAAGVLFAGTFAEVRLELPARDHVFVLPVETLIFRKEGLQLGTVVDGKVKLVTVEPGRDFGDHIEIVRGLTGDELVIASPPDSITQDEPVRLATPANAPRVSTRPQ